MSECLQDMHRSWMNTCLARWACCHQRDYDKWVSLFQQISLALQAQLRLERGKVEDSEASKSSLEARMATSAKA